MAPIGQPLLQGFDPALERGNPGVRGQAVLEEVEAAAWAQHPSNLGERCGWVGNGAERERAQRAITAGVVEGDRLPIESDLFDWNTS